MRNVPTSLIRRQLNQTIEKALAKSGGKTHTDWPQSGRNYCPRARSPTARRRGFRNHAGRALSRYRGPSQHFARGRDGSTPHPGETRRGSASRLLHGALHLRFPESLSFSDATLRWQKLRSTRRRTGLWTGTIAGLAGPKQTSGFLARTSGWPSIRRCIPSLPPVWPRQSSACKKRRAIAKRS